MRLTTLHMSSKKTSEIKEILGNRSLGDYKVDGYHSDAINTGEVETTRQTDTQTHTCARVQLTQDKDNLTNQELIVHILTFKTEIYSSF